MNKFINILVFLLILTAGLQAAMEIGQVVKIINNYVLINTNMDLGDRGMQYDVYRMVGFDYQRIGRLEVVKALQNGIAAKEVESFNGQYIQVGDVLLSDEDDYSEMSGTEFGEPLSGSPLERLESLELAAPAAGSGDSFKSPLEKLSALEGAAK